jgi:hypothetical protein
VSPDITGERHGFFYPHFLPFLTLTSKLNSFEIGYTALVTGIVGPGARPRYVTRMEI